MADQTQAVQVGGWWVRNAQGIKVLFRVLFGGLWLAAGILKFLPGFADGFYGMIQDAASSAPAWLQGWYSFWLDAASTNGTLIVYTVGTLEVLLGLALILGLGRKIAYFGGIALSLLIWTVPEAFGGPYSTGAGATDLGTGITYAVMFVGLIALNAAFGPSKWSIDYAIEQQYPGWARVAELNYTKASAKGSPPKPGAITA